jgi:DNA-binding NtrC family response regulator
MNITLGDSEQFGMLVGKSQVMRKVYETMLRAAATDAPVVIYGETGTGKELTARTIFDLSDSHTQSFVPVNCASIPENLFESAFFGHRKGAFTGADRHHIGYFEQAQGGTLFLDEVGELPLTMQAKLLRVLNDHTYTPVGATAHRTADVRIIAATNQELRALTRQGKMRSDFFHRLHVLAIDLPPLRGRKEDIPLLIAHFCQQHVSETAPATIPPALLERFAAYDWPGNVRELFNEVQRYLATGNVELAGSLPDAPSGEKPGLELPDDLSLSDAIEHLEHYYIPRTLSRQSGHKTRTADILGIDRKTLYRKQKKYGLA